MCIGFLAICGCEWSHSSFTKIGTKHSLVKFLMTHNFYGNHDLITAVLRYCHIACKFNRGFNESCVFIEILSKDMFAWMFIKELHDAVHRYAILDILHRKGQD
jgi:hypothetical protein